MKNSVAYFLAATGFCITAIILISSRLSVASIPFSLMSIYFNIQAYLEHKNGN